ncbi:hypothetical protein [Nocardia farcinica]|uniref:hypothetical protein n=1 Tax=Nocardia farcinica TaxID=37329 RepID=UPI002454DDCA|nr:hypothetical protein [Nocardia farcinica]
MTGEPLKLDYGQAEIGAFLDSARSGHLNFDPNAVTEMVGIYDNLLLVLTTARRNLAKVTDAQGFGGFKSAQELQAGFGGKATEGIEVIDQLIAGVLDLQAAYLYSAQKLTEVDQLNQTRIRLAAEGIGV